MSDIDELRWLIEQEKERGNKLDRQMSAERKLFEEAGEGKKKLIIALLKEELQDFTEEE